MSRAQSLRCLWSSSSEQSLQPSASPCQAGTASFPAGEGSWARLLSQTWAQGQGVTATSSTQPAQAAPLPGNHREQSLQRTEI